MPVFDDLPVVIRVVLLITSALVLIVGAGLFWRMVKSLFAKNHRR